MFAKRISRYFVFCVALSILLTSRHTAWSQQTLGAISGTVSDTSGALLGDASVSAGPVGRTASAETDVTMRAEMLSYSRSRGVFAGISGVLLAYFLGHISPSQFSSFRASIWR